MNTVIGILERRNALIVRLIHALKHIDHDEQIAIITAFFSISQLEALVKFQERE